MNPPLAAPAPIDLLMQAYNRLNAGNLELLDTVYSPDVVFIDPAHELHGLPALRSYFARQYAQVRRAGFEFHDRFGDHGRVMLTWTLHLEHPRLRGGRPLAVAGASELRYAGQVYYHRDYFDLGALLYENLPLLGGLVRAVRNQL